MQSSSSSSTVQPEAILEWLQKEMGYTPLGPYSSTSKSNMPSIDSIRKICRGNMIPVWSFLIKRVKSEKTVENIRKNITVHGSGSGGGGDSGNSGKEEGKSSRGGRRKEKTAGERESASENREAALNERESAAKEVEQLRNIVRRQMKDLRARMLEVSREEAERKRMLDERANYRHKQMMLEAYDQQCDEAAKIFAEYHKRLRQYVSQARDAERTSADSSVEVINSFTANSEKEAVYSTVKGTKLVDDFILIETTRERNIRKACEALAAHILDKIRFSFPAYEGSGIHSNPQLEVAKIGSDFAGEIPDEVRTVIVNCLKSPPQLLQAITGYTLRYKYENNTVMDVSSPDVSSSLNYQLYGNGKVGVDASSKGAQNQLLERQKAHVQQFLATEDALNKAAEARDLCQNLIKRLHGSGDVISSRSIVGGTSQNVGSLRQFELEVWAKEREAAGLRASLNTLISEIQRLNKLCAERKEAEDSLKKKWKKIEEFDARRSELEIIYTALLKANTCYAAFYCNLLGVHDAAGFWNQQPLAAREYASSTIIPACTVVVDISNDAKDLIDKEVSAFYRSPDNTLYMLPSTPQALLDAMGTNGSTGPEAVAAAEKNAALLTARAGARDPSAIPSICRVSAALQYPAGLEGSDAGLASVLESHEFCLKLRGSEASVLEDLAKAINLVYIRRDLVESGHTLLNHAYGAQHEYESSPGVVCVGSLIWGALAEALKVLIEALKVLTSHVTTLSRLSKLRSRPLKLRLLRSKPWCLDEWWEQPASTVVDGVTVDGQNVAAWHNHVKQLLAFYDQELL
ncbi:hypothetical protein JRO89_XS12G0209400 [Xanthoceras sorbifolium]|uniref:AUGMIN subunit 5 n=1 Tax=Xanthoceras sorbifolium TaxID=99658 RepID=A0ABQ8HD61_9ROSI|nr:hypothetical protein JRO89_XS12G0209400 [Xanthoceras sorbifolium]